MRPEVKPDGSGRRASSKWGVSCDPATDSCTPCSSGVGGLAYGRCLYPGGSQRPVEAEQGHWLGSHVCHKGQTNMQIIGSKSIILGCGVCRVST